MIRLESQVTLNRRWVGLAAVLRHTYSIDHRALAEDSKRHHGTKAATTFAPRQPDLNTKPYMTVNFVSIDLRVEGKIEGDADSLYATHAGPPTTTESSPVFNGTDREIEDRPSIEI